MTIAVTFPRTTFKRIASVGAVLLAGLAASTLPLMAQSTEGTTSRFPATGIAILDCAPKIEALQDSCVLRVPPTQERDNLKADNIGDASGEFVFVRSGDSRFPKGVTLSETIILIDLSPGPNGKRRSTFNAERQMIRQFVQSLPAGESIAVYGFNQEMTRLSNFSTDRFKALSAIDAIKLSGSNTRISTFTKEAIVVLDGRKNTVLKNVFIVSDGDEEGDDNTASVTKAAIDANVSVSALGMFWRPVGSAANGAGMDYLDSLTKGTLGSSVQLQLGQLTQSRETLQEFQRTVAKSIRGSGLIVPDGTPQESDIVVTIKKPAIGAPGSFTEEDIRVRFTPTSAGGAEPEVVVIEEKMLFGYPALWVYGAAAAIFGLFLLLLLLLVFRKRSPDQDDDDGFEIDFDDPSAKTALSHPQPVVATGAAAVKPQAIAYLVENGSGRRHPIHSSSATIGRGDENNVTLSDDSVSRNHAQLTRTPNGDFRLVDLGSLNGSFVNNKKVTEKVAVTSGDEIKFGEIETRFVLV